MKTYWFALTIPRDEADRLIIERKASGDRRRFDLERGIAWASPLDLALLALCSLIACLLWVAL